MDSFQQISNYLSEYGYYAIFILVFLQQIGVPNPITNELVLIFCSYLSYSGTLSFYKAILSAALADVVGSTLIFLLFYSFSKWLIDKSPKWLPLTGDKIERMKARVLKNGYRGMFFARITPVVRGYTSVVAGMLNIGRKGFITLIAITALFWNGILVLIGLLIGPYWGDFKNNLGIFGNILVGIVAIVIIMYVGRFFLRKQTEEKA